MKEWKVFKKAADDLSDESREKDEDDECIDDFFKWL
jgi:hypothetical protein